MRAHVSIEPGVCGFRTRIVATSDDGQHVAFSVSSTCERISRLAEELAASGPVDAYAELAAGSNGRLLTLARGALCGGCAGCVTPAALFKAMQVAAGLALPQDVVLHIGVEDDAA